MLTGAAGIAPALEGGAALVLLAAFVVAVGGWMIYVNTIRPLLRWLAARMHAVRINVKITTIRPLDKLGDALDYIDREVEVGFTAAIEQTQRGATFFIDLARRQLVWIGDEISGLAHDVAARFARAAAVDVPAAIRQGTAPLWRRISHVDERLHLLAGAVAAELPQLGRHLHALDLRAARVIAIDLPRLGTRIGEWEGRTAKQARAHARRLARLESLLGVAGAVAVVTTALRALKLEWIRCPSLNRINRRVGCAPWRLLEDIFLGSFVALAATDLCRWTGLVDTAARQLRPALYTFVDVEEALVGCHGATRARQVPLRGYDPTPVVDPIRV